jgi:hypothetical protein
MIGSVLMRNHAAHAILYVPMYLVPLSLAVSVVDTANEPEESRVTLPSDGAWVRYKVQLQDEEEGVVSHDEFVTTISLVGTASDKEQRCRWVEMKSVAFDSKGAPSRTHLTKLLIPETEMLKSNNPLKQAVRGWVRVADEQPSLMVPISWDPGLFVGESLSWLPGVRAGLREVDKPRDVEYQRGKLNRADAVSGTREWTKTETPELGNSHWKSRFTVWHHADLHWGFARAEVEAEKWLGDEREARVTFTYLLEDAGKDARSALPESN